MDAGKVVIVPFSSKAPEAAKWKLVLTDPSLGELLALTGWKWSVSQMIQMLWSGAESFP